MSRTGVNAWIAGLLLAMLASPACVANTTYFGTSQLLSPSPLRLAARVIRGDAIARSVEVELALSTEEVEARKVCVGFPMQMRPR